jgi:hypothetical protein
VTPGEKYLNQAVSLEDSRPNATVESVSLESDARIDTPSQEQPNATLELREPATAVEEAAVQPVGEPTLAAPSNAVRIANLPETSNHTPPELAKPDLKELLKSKDSENVRPTPIAIPGESLVESAKTNWYQPTALLAMLDDAANIPSTSAWAKEAKELIKQLGPAMLRDSKESLEIMARLESLLKKVPGHTEQMAQAAQKAILPSQKSEMWSELRTFRRAAYAIERRMEIWRSVAKLGPDRLNRAERASADPAKLMLCMSHTDSSLPKSREGECWREYLLLDAMKESANRNSKKDEANRKQVAKLILERLNETPMSNQQRQFLNRPQIVALREELRNWAADPVTPADVLRSVERYEQSGLVSDGRRLARQLQSLCVASDEAERELAARVDAYYRNANLRVAISEKMLNKLIPPPKTEYGTVHDTVLNVPVHGRSLTSSDLSIRFIPDPERARLALVVTGEVAATTSSTSGPATFYNDSEAYYAAQKQVEINKKGFLRLLPAEVEVRHSSRLRDVSTDLDGIPLLSQIARRVAQTQHDFYSDSANEEARQKVASRARERIDNEALQQFSAMVDRMNENMFGPLVKLSLEPTILDAQTTKERLTMRLRVAGEDQLGSNTPRPQAPSDCLISFQIHESMINNALGRLQLEGKTFTLPQLAKRFAERFQRSNLWNVNPEHEDVKITFAEKDAITVRCRDGQVVLTISVAELSKEPRGWNNFQVEIFFKPDINGRFAELVGVGSIQLSGDRMSLGSQIALRGVFVKAFPRNQRVSLMPDRFLKDANLKDLGVSQFTIDDGWIGVAIGDKAREVRTARLPGR